MSDSSSSSFHSAEEGNTLEALSTAPPVPSAICNPVEYQQARRGLGGLNVFELLTEMENLKEKLAKMKLAEERSRTELIILREQVEDWKREECNARSYTEAWKRRWMELFEKAQNLEGKADRVKDQWARRARGLRDEHDRWVAALGELKDISFVHWGRREGKIDELILRIQKTTYLP